MSDLLALLLTRYIASFTARLIRETCHLIMP